MGPMLLLTALLIIMLCSVNNLIKKAENPRSGRKMTAICPDNVDSVRNSVGKGSEKVHPKTFPRTWSFTCIVAKNLKEVSSDVPM